MESDFMALTRQQTLQLQLDRPVTFSDARDIERVEVISGIAWLTQAHRMEDIFLQTEETYAPLSQRGALTIEAIDAPTCVRLTHHATLLPTARAREGFTRHLRVALARGLHRIACMLEPKPHCIQ